MLVDLASLLRREASQSALVARYGGEEFAVVLLNTDRLTATQLTKSISQAIEDTKINCKTSDILSITVSIDVATLKGSAFRQAGQLVKASDKGVYEAKTAGLRCVRIFAPRTEPKKTASDSRKSGRRLLRPQPPNHRT